MLIYKLFQVQLTRELSSLTSELSGLQVQLSSVKKHESELQMQLNSVRDEVIEKQELMDMMKVKHAG